MLKIPVFFIKGAEVIDILNAEKILPKFFDILKKNFLFFYAYKKYEKKSPGKIRGPCGYRQAMPLRAMACVRRAVLPEPASAYCHAVVVRRACRNH